MKIKTAIGALAAMTLLAIPALAHAGQLSWGGDVDERTVVSVHRSDVTFRTVSGKDPINVHVHMDGRLRKSATNIRLVDWNGRGTVTLVRAPSPNNDFTAVVRIDDPQAGRGHYHFKLAWDGDTP